MTDTEALNAIRKEMTPLAPKVTKAINALLPPGERVALRWRGALAPCERQAEGRIIREETEDIIEIALKRIEEPDRWRTYIHELIHSHSPLYTRPTYDANVGWEEAVVEYLQRAIRSSVLAGPPEGEFDGAMVAHAEADWPYNHYLKEMEGLRQDRGVSDADAPSWYARLLRIPLGERYNSLLEPMMDRQNLNLAGAARLRKADLALKQKTITRTSDI